MCLGMYVCMRVYLLIDTNIEMERLISYKKKRKKKKWRDWLLIKQKKKMIHNTIHILITVFFWIFRT